MVTAMSIIGITRRRGNAVATANDNCRLTRELAVDALEHHKLGKLQEQYSEQFVAEHHNVHSGEFGLAVEHIS